MLCEEPESRVTGFDLPVKSRPAVRLARTGDESGPENRQASLYLSPRPLGAITSALARRPLSLQPLRPLSQPQRPIQERRMSFGVLLDDGCCPGAQLPVERPIPYVAGAAYTAEYPSEPVPDPRHPEGAQPERTERR